MGTLVLLLWVAFLFSMLFLGVKHFFVPALEIMSKALHLPDDIAGATLLAFGNGSPDVFTQIAAAKELNAKTFPLAVSEPLGGGLFVSNVVVAIIIFLAGKNGVVLGKAAFLRDTGFYSVALILVFSFVIDGKVVLAEGLLLLAFYALFVVYLAVSPKFLGTGEDKGEGEQTEPLVSNGDAEAGQVEAVEKADDDKPKTITDYATMVPMTLLYITVPKVSMDGTLMPWYHAMLLPLLYPMFLLIAKGWLVPFAAGAPWNFTYAFVTGLIGCMLVGAAYPKDPTVKNGYLHGIFTVLAFIQCIVWVMFSTGEAVAALKALGYVYGVNQVILGATVLAWGNSLADAVSDPAMAAAGYPAMGLAAAIASPLFTLLGGLGIVFTSKIIQNGTILIEPNAALYTGFVFAIVNMLRYIGLAPVTGWKLTKPIAIFNVVLYICFQVLYCVNSVGSPWPWGWAVNKA